MILYNLKCEKAECPDLLGVVAKFGQWGNCPECGGPLDYLPTVLHTDVRGQPFYSIASGEYHTSRRDLENHMKLNGYPDYGSPMGGGIPQSTLGNATFSYTGQASRTSGSERAATRERNYTEARRGQKPDVAPVN